MQFGRYAVLGAAHLRCATAERLTAWAKLPPTHQPVAVAATGYGWFVATHPSAPESELPEELVAILAFGREHDCRYVLIDSDGDEVAALPVFPW